MSPRDVEEKDENVASLQLQATSEMCHYCFDVLVNELAPSSSSSRSKRFSSEQRQQQSRPLFADTIPPAAEAPLFVTWDKRRFASENFELRGCIGTLSPRPLLTAVGEYALTSAFRDRRFEPIKTDEVPHLRVAVSLLVNYEESLDCHDWVVGVHGIIIKFSEGGIEYSATYLPEVAKEQGWSQQETVVSLVRKSGYSGPVRKGLLQKIKLTRYQSSKHRLTYQQYVDLVGKDPLKHERKRRFLFF